MTLDLGLRWEGTWHPEMLVQPEDTFFAPYLDDPRFPSDGRIPDDLDNFQPRAGLAWNLAGDGRTVLRANGGSYVARIPMLVFAQHRSTNGAFQQILFRSSPAAAALGPVPPIDSLIDASTAPPFLPDIQVADRNLELPRTWSFSTGLDRDLGRGVAASATFVHARTDHLFRFVNRNDPVFGSPFGIGTHVSGGGINALTVTESSARSRYQGLTLGLRGRGAVPEPTDHLRDPLHARLRPLRRRQRARPVHPALRERRATWRPSTAGRTATGATRSAAICWSHSSRRSAT